MLLCQSKHVFIIVYAIPIPLMTNKQVSYLINSIFRTHKQESMNNE